MCSTNVLHADDLTHQVSSIHTSWCVHMYCIIVCIPVSKYCFVTNIPNCETPQQFPILPECYRSQHPLLVCPHIQYRLPSSCSPPIPSLSPVLIAYPLTPSWCVHTIDTLLPAYAFAPLALRAVLEINADLVPP